MMRAAAAVPPVLHPMHTHTSLRHLIIWPTVYIIFSLWAIQTPGCDTALIFALIKRDIYFKSAFIYSFFSKPSKKIMLFICCSSPSIDCFCFLSLNGFNFSLTFFFFNGLQTKCKVSSFIIAPFD